MPKTTKIVAALGVASALSIATVPFCGSFAATTGNEEIKIMVPGTLSMTVTTSGTDPSAATNVAPGNSNEAKKNVVKVTGNDNFKVTLADADTNTNLVSGSNTIATYTSDKTSVSDGWGVTTTAAYGTNHTGSFTNGTYKGMPSSSGTALVVVQTSNTSASFTDDSTTVQYGTKIPSTQAAGTYSDTVSFTLSAV